MASIHGYFTKCVRDTAGKSLAKKTAAIFGDSTISFRQLDRLSDALMTILTDMYEQFTQSSGSTDTKRIAVCMSPSLDFLIVLLAVLKLKAAYVPIDTECSPDRLQLIISDAKPSLVICDNTKILENSIPMVPVIECARLLELAREPCRRPLCPVFHITDQNLPAIILYTSGSRGPPQQISITHRMIMNRILWMWNDFPYKEEEIGLVKSPSTSADNLTEIFAPLLSGRTILMVKPNILENPAEFFSVLQRYPVCRITVAPRLLKYLCDYMEMEGKTFYGPLDLLITTGEVLSNNLAMKFYEYFPRTKLANFYGLPEAGGNVLSIVFDSKDHFESVVVDSVIPLGKVINNFAMMVVDEKFRPVRRNVLGELVLSGNIMQSTQFSRRNSFQLANDNVLWYRTGDLGFIHHDTGHVYLKGKLADQISIGGKRFHLSEIEELLTQIPSIRDSAVVKTTDGNCTKICAFYYSGDSGDSSDELASHKTKKSLRRHLPSFVQPSFIQCDEPFPLLSNGKVDRKRLHSMFADKVTGWENIDVPTPLSIVAGVLNRPANAVELDQSFGDNGGTSMDLVQTILQLGQSNFKISLPEFLAAVTVRELIAQCDWTPPGSAVKSFSPIGTVSPRKQHDFTAVTFSTSSKEDVVNLLNAAFAGEANELSEGYPRLMTSDELRHIAEKFVDEAAADASGSSFCFGVEEKGMIEAVAIAFDIYGDFAQARRIFTGPPGPVTRLVESIMTPFLSAIPAKPGTVVRNFLVTTNSTLPLEKSISLINYVEEHLENLARSAGYQYVVTVNSNKIKQQLAELRASERWATYQANRLALPDGSIPLADAEESLKITLDVCNAGRSAP